mgnify:CR=1 FL=1
MDYKKKYLKYKIKYNSIKKLFGGSSDILHPPPYPKNDAKRLRYKIRKQNTEIENYKTEIETCNKELLRLRQIGNENFRINQHVLSKIRQLISLFKSIDVKQVTMDKQNIRIFTNLLNNINDIIINR